MKDSLRASNDTVTVADGSIEIIDGESLISLRIGDVEKSLSVRCVRSLAYDCILGMDFLNLFEFVIDFEHGLWRASGIDEFVRFDCGLERSELASCAGLAHVSDQQRELIDALLDKYIEPPGEILKATNLAKHVRDVQGHKPIRHKMRRHSPIMVYSLRRGWKRPI